jgi:putative sigma-54 modulation protein
MDIRFTARHFKARESLKDYSIGEIERLRKFYDGIVNAEIILSFENTRNSVKVAEISLKVFGTHLTAVEKSDDFFKSVDYAVGKIERQLKKYKDKHRVEKYRKREVILEVEEEAK